MYKTISSNNTIVCTPISEHICDIFCAAFALWTICCNTMVAIGGSLQWLVTIYVLVLCAISVISFIFFRKRQKTSNCAIGNNMPTTRDQTYRIIQCFGFFLGLVGIMLFIRYGFNVLFWGWAIGLLGAVSISMFVFEKRPTISLAVHGRSLESILFAIALVCAIFTLILHRSDADDAFYINIAVAYADNPKLALMSGDTLHGINGLPLYMPVYRVQSYELLNGAISYITGISAIYCFHWISAALAGFLVPLVYAKLFRMLIPHVWLWGVCALVFVLFSTGETHRWYGNFSFVRMWQGKAIFLFVFLPLIYTYALQFSLRPSIRTWILLCSAQIAATGCTSSALWAGPVSAILTLCCTLRPKREDLRVFVVGIFASSYVLGVGWYLKEVMVSKYIRMPHAGHAFQYTSEIILGDSNLSIFGIASILLAWALCKRGLAQRFATVLPFVVFLFIINPFSYNWVSANMTGPSFWRCMWVMPIPILLVFLLISPLQIDKSKWTRIGGRIIFFLFLAVFAVFVPRFSGVSLKNKVLIHCPDLKVPELEYKLASTLNESVSPGAYVVAPRNANMWIPTFHNHAYPLIVRHYLTELGQGNERWRRLSSENILARNKMIGYAENIDRSEKTSILFREGLERFHIEGVCINTKGPIKDARTILRETGFHKKAQIENYEIWIRD